MESRAAVDFALEQIGRGDLAGAIRSLETDEEAERIGANYAQLCTADQGSVWSEQGCDEHGRRA